MFLSSGAFQASSSTGFPGNVQLFRPLQVRSKRSIERKGPNNLEPKNMIWFSNPNQCPT